MSTSLDWYETKQEKCPKCNSIDIWENLILTPIFYSCEDCKYQWWEKMTWETVLHILDNIHQIQEDGDLDKEGYKKVPDDVIKYVKMIIEQCSKKYECTLTYIKPTRSGTIRTRWDSHHFEFKNQDETEIHFLDIKNDTIRCFIDHPKYIDPSVYEVFLLVR